MNNDEMLLLEQLSKDVQQFKKTQTRVRNLDRYLDMPKHILYSQADEIWSIEDKEWFIRKEVFRFCKYYPNLKTPKTYNEKINWYKLHYKDNLMTLCVDKYSFKDFVRDKIGEKYVAKDYGYIQNIDDLNLKELPSKFVAKSSWGSGSRHVFICKDKKLIKDIDTLKYSFDSWLRPWTNVYWHTFDWAYKNVVPRIFFEEYIGDRELEYDFFCFYGKPEFFFVAKDSSPNEKNYRNIYDMNWNLLPVKRNADNFPVAPEKPKNFDEMVEIASVLSKPFPHTRVDLLKTSDGIKAMELTFYTGSGLHPWTPTEYDKIFGDYFDLPSPNM